MADPGLHRLACSLIAWLVDNESMNGNNSNNAGNKGLNSNAVSIRTVRATAGSFKDEVWKLSTTMILSPAKAEYGTASKWIISYLEAINQMDTKDANAGQVTLRCF